MKIKVMVTTVLACVIVVMMTSCSSSKKLTPKKLAKVMVPTTQGYQNTLENIKLKVPDLYQGQSLEYIRKKSRTAKVADLPDADFILGSVYTQIIISKKPANGGGFEVVRQDVEKLLVADDSVFLREGEDLSKTQPFYLISGEADTDIFLVWKSSFRKKTTTTAQQQSTTEKVVIVPTVDCSSVRVVCPSSPLGNTSEIEKKKREAYSDFQNGLLTRDQYNCTISRLRTCPL